VTAALALAPPDRIRDLAQPIIEAVRLSQKNGDLTHWRLIQNGLVSTLSLSAGLPALFKFGLGATAVSMWLVAEGIDAAESFADFNEKLRELTPPDSLPSADWMFALAGDGGISEVSHKLAAFAALTGPDAATRFGAGLVGLSLPTDRLLAAFGVADWKDALFRLVATEARDKGAKFGEVIGGLTEGLLGLAGAVSSNGRATAFVQETVDSIGEAVRSVAAGISNAFGDLTRRVTGASFDWPSAPAFPSLQQTATEFITRIRGIDPLALVGIGSASAVELPNDFKEAAETVAWAGEKVVLRVGAGPNPFDSLGFDPDASVAPSDGASENSGRQFSLYLPYAAGRDGQRILLRLEGADADKFTVFSAKGTQPITGGRFSLVVPEGTQQIAFTLWNDEDVDASQTLTLHAALADATGVATHKEHEEAKIALAAVDEPPFTPPSALVTDPEPENPEIYGTDADEQILGKDSADVIYPLLGADFVRAGLGDDRVLVYWTAESDTAGDRVELGEGNDFAVRWAGADTLIGGRGADVMLAGADADTLYAEGELALADAIALGETQGAGGEADLLDGWAGNDVAVGWGGADGLLGGDGADVLVGMGGDDDVFGDLQFSQYTSASADWRVERETTWITPDRRRVTARLVSVLVTQKDVPGGADTIFGGAGADWLFGQAGDDFIDGGRDADVLFGDEGADALYGRDGADILSGDDLDDGTPGALAGALHGADTLDGGAGDHRIAFANGSFWQRIEIAARIPRPGGRAL
jgi:Ca2+-binding RTX toxin-like protein